MNNDQNNDDLNLFDLKKFVDNNMKARKGNFHLHIDKLLKLLEV